MNSEASIDNLFEGGKNELSQENLLAGEVMVLKEENEKLTADLTAANECLDMLFMKRDEQLEEQKAHISKLEKKVKDLTDKVKCLTLKATPTSKHNCKAPFKL